MRLLRAYGGFIPIFTLLIGTGIIMLAVFGVVKGNTAKDFILLGLAGLTIVFIPIIVSLDRGKEGKRLGEVIR